MKMYTFTINGESIFNISAENIENAVKILNDKICENDKSVLEKINNKCIE